MEHGRERDYLHLSSKRADQYNMIGRLLEEIGGMWGDPREGLICANDHFYHYSHDRDFVTCPMCGTEIFAKIPHSEQLALRWQLWRMDHFPHRMMSFHDENGDTKWWEYKHKRYFERPFSWD